MSSGTQIRVLGPVEIIASSGESVLPGSRLRTLLAELVISAGRAVPISTRQLVLWSDRPPAAADNTLQTDVSQLRRVLGPESVVLVDHSYRLDIEAGSIDAVRFDWLLAAATEHRSDAER